MSHSNSNESGVIAIDDGYGDVKYSDGVNASLIPSFISTFKPKPQVNFSNTEGGESSNYLASKINDSKYLIGDYASKLDPDIQWKGGERKHDDIEFPVLFKSILGLISNDSSKHVSTLMMSLPVSYDTQERRSTLTNICEGTHQVAISHDGENFTNKEITIDAVSIKKQPFGSLCDLILDSKGEITNKELARGFNVIVDIGARTLNVMTLDALEEHPELTTQFNEGVFSAYMKIGKWLEDELRVTIPDGKLPHIIKNKSIKNTDITEVVNKAFESQANTITSIIDKMFITSWGFIDTIIFTGGGSEILKVHLEDAFANSKLVFLNRYSNVKGLYKYGLRQEKKNKHRTGMKLRVDRHEQ